MNFNLVPRLTFACELSVTVSLYYHEGVCNSTSLTVNSLKASQLVHSLPVPENIKEDLLNLVQPVGEQIAGWLKEFHWILSSHVGMSNKLSWKNNGTVDYSRTAENFIVSGNLGDIDAFKLACSSSNCDHIFRLWPAVQDRMLEEMSQSGFAVENFSRLFPLWLKLWVAYLSDQMDKYRTANRVVEIDNNEKFLFWMAVQRNNVGAASFFLERLKAAEKRQIVKDLAIECVLLHRRHFDPSTFLFLVSRMNAEEVVEILNSFPAECLMHFLTFPLQEFFMELTNLIWSDFPFPCSHIILDRICAKIMQMQVPRTYEKIFTALWKILPEEYQLQFYNDHIYLILNGLFKYREPSDAIIALFKGGMESYINFLNVFFLSPSAVISILVEDNKFKAFKNLLELFDKADLVDDFESQYAVFTQAYLSSYYGDEISSESSSE